MENRKVKWTYQPVQKVRGILHFSKNGKKVKKELQEKYQVCMDGKKGWIRIPKHLLTTLSMILIVFNVAFAQYPTEKEVQNFSSLGRVLMNIEKDHVSKFIAENYELANSVQQKHGIPKALLLAQMCLESGYGRSKFAVERCNYLGIKGRHGYLHFKNIEDCIAVYVETLTNNCYKNQFPQSINCWLDALECCGYATSKEYKSKLKFIIKKYNLSWL